MSQFKISGVWKDSEGTITHYAFHTITATGGITRATKKTKAQAITLLEINENSARTWIWNYNSCCWVNGETVEVVNDRTGKYLRSNPDNKLTNNLGHLIVCNWFIE